MVHFQQGAGPVFDEFELLLLVQIWITDIKLKIWTGSR